MNNILQLGYFYDLDFQKSLGTTNFFLGFTASNSEAGSTINILDWKLRLVSANISYSFNALVPSDNNDNIFQINQQFIVNIYLRNGCNGKYHPNDKVDDIRNFTLDNSFASSCNLLDRAWSTDSNSSFQLFFSCSTPGLQSLVIYYFGQIVGIPVSIKIISSQMVKAKIDFFQGTVSTIDNPFQFKFIPYDSNDNIPNITIDNVRSNLNIQWPQAVDSNKDFQITLDTDGTFIVSLNTNKTGKYIITNLGLLGCFVANGQYQFTIEPGNVDYSNSFARLIDPAKFQVITGNENVGINLLLNVYFKDKAGNAIPTSKIGDDLVNSILNVNGAQSLLTNPQKNFLFYAYTFTLYNAGQASIVVTYLNKPISCQYCSMTVNGGASLFEDASLFPWNNNTNNFDSSDQTEYIVNKGDNFLFLLVLKDQYNNTVPVNRVSDYLASLTGNNMNVLNLVLTAFSIGIKLEVASTDQSYYENLVGLPNYSINVIEVATQKQRTWSLTIISDKTDIGAGNGDYAPENTIWFWLNPLEQNQYAIAGHTYRVAVQLMTNQNLIYNGYIDESLVVCNFQTLLSNIGEVLTGPRRTAITGTYIFTFSLIQGNFIDRIIGFTINGVTLSKTKTFKDYPADPVKSLVGAESLIGNNGFLLNTGEVNKPYSFLYLVFDRFNNPTNIPVQTLGLTMKSLDKSHKTQILTPNCQNNNVGNYSCLVTAKVLGNYTMDSSFLNNSNIETYYLYFNRNPALMKIVAGIVSDLTKGVSAGDQLNFMIKVFDESNVALNRIEILNFYKFFSLSVQQPNASTLADVPLLTITDKGEIVTTYTISKIGKYLFSPKYDVININCPVCSVDVKANNANTTKILIFSYDDNVETPISNETALKLDNSKKDPIYILRFRDSFNNPLNIPTDGVFSANLTVPNGAKGVYYFEVATWGSDAIKMQIQDIDYAVYKSELSNPNATLTFVSQSQTKQSLNENFTFNAVLTGVSSDDDNYSNDDPNRLHSIVSPLDITIIAGDWTDLHVELRTIDDKLYNHPMSFGWYADKANSLKMITADGLAVVPGVTCGKQKGTYNLHFTCYKAYLTGVYVNVSYLSPKDNQTWVLMAKRFKLTVLTAAVKYLIMDETTVNNAVVGQKVVNFMKPYDLYGNLIGKIAVNGLNIQMSSSNLNETAIIPDLSQNVAGEVFSAYSLTRPGLITIKALKFKSSEGKIVSSYSFNVTAGPIDFISSMALVDRNNIQAGETVNWIIYPRDSFNNPLSCNNYDMVNFSASKIEPNNGNAVALSERIAISQGNDYYYWTVNLTIMGTHQFKAFYKGDLVRSTNDKVIVNAGAVDFYSMNLALFNSKTNSYEDYDGMKFYQDIASLPEYKVEVFDQFKNQLASLPPTWNLSLYLTNGGLGTKYGIFFCLDSSLQTFQMCPDNKLQQNLVAPLNRWNDLDTPKDFTLELLNTNTNDMQNYSMSLSGSSNDSNNSSLPIEIQNTMIIPRRIDTTVNQTFQFQIIIMTSDSTKRRNEWFVDPLQSISLQFSKNALDYSISYGEKKGMYKCSLISTTAYVNDPNLITVVITGITVQAKNVQLFVTPGLAYLFYPYDIVNKKILANLTNGSIDSHYSQAFIANDYWGNLINLQTDTPTVNSQIFDPQNTLIISNKLFPLDNEAVVLSFDPKIPGYFFIQFNNNSNFQAYIAQGRVNIPKSLGNASPNTIRAGETVTITLRLNDQYGNALVMTQDLLNQYIIQYFFSLPNDDVYFEGTSPLNIINNQVVFTQKLMVQGVNKFKIALNTQPVAMSQSRILVNPNDPSIQNSILLYLDDDTNRYLVADSTVPIKENNEKYDPFYSLILMDKYGNQINEFPTNFLNQFEVILYGNDYAIDYPIHFLSNNVTGNSLSITIDPIDQDRYRAGITEPNPYNLSITLLPTKSSLNYLVNLLGSGNDNNTDIEKPMDPNQTYFDKTALKIVAGNSDVFMIEIRTSNGNRNCDVPLNLSINLTFSDDSDNPENSNYSYQISPGDLRGRFLIRVSGTRANDRTNPAMISLTLNGSLVNDQVSLTISPANLDHITTNTDFSQVVSTDNDFKFIMIPYDIFNNVANVKISDLNVFVRFPITWSGAQDFSGFIDPNTGYASYLVKNRGAGDYTVNSIYLTPGILYTVVPGKINEFFTRVLVNPLQIRAGDRTFIDVYPADAYNNPISPLGNRQSDCVNKIMLKFKQDSVINSALLGPNTQNNSLFQSLKFIKTGLVTILVTVDSKAVTCQSCIVQVTANIAYLANTLFFIMQTDGTYQATNHPTSPYGASNINLIAQLLDQFNNPLQQIDDNELFKMSMRGNNMNPLDLLVQKTANQTNGLLIDVDKSDSAYFQTLVVSPNYTLTLFYLIDSQIKDTADLLLDIIGNSDDSGNGDVDITKTVTPFNLTLIAGKAGSMALEFRTNQNKRYAGQIALSSLLVKETDASNGTQKLSIGSNFADRTGRFIITLQGYEALSANNYKYIQIGLNGQNCNNLVIVSIDPDVPDPSKTEILQQLPIVVKGNTLFPALLRLYDTYNNIYTKSNWVSKVQGRATDGRSNFQETTFDPTNNAYIINIIPLYPPRILEFQVVLVNDAGNEFNILSIPWLSQVINDLDLSKTEIRGNNLSGVALGQDFEFYVLLKDVDGYCYEATRNVTVNLSGPYENNDLNSTTLTSNGVLASFLIKGMAKNAAIEKSSVQANGTNCLKYYEVEFYGNQIQQVGYYLIQVYLDGGATPIYSYKNAYMSPGNAYPGNSFLSLISPSNLAQDAILAVSTPVVLRLQLRDSFKNQLTTCNGSTIDLQFTGLNNPQDFTLKIVSGNGYFDVNVVVKTTGSISGGIFVINGQSIQWKLLDQSNMPSSFIYGPDKCSNLVPNMDVATLQSNKSIIGYRTYFKVNCLDQYGNLVVKGGDQFSSQIISIGDISTAQSINIPVNVIDDNDGSYIFEFTPTYNGLYKGIVQLNNNPYGSIFFFQIIAGLCNATKPYYCKNIATCAASYLNCGYSDLNCPTKNKPFQCPVTVNGTTTFTCVKTQEECDCPDNVNQAKCSSDNKCVNITLIDSKCSFKGQNLNSFSCPVEIPILCSDGSCRLTATECPSQPGCPPEYKLCPDLTCIENTLSCPERGTSCPNDRYYRCDDFSCVSNPDDCPSRITCPTPGQVVCPDGSCVENEVFCTAPRQCNSGLVLCSDNSCMKSYDDCAKGVTCPTGQSLCQGGICQKQCVKVNVQAKSPKIVRLLRMLDGNNTDNSMKLIGACGANQTRCKGTDICVDQPGLCPTIPKCKLNEVKCGDFYCASSQKDCRIKGCPSGTYQCWDKTCVSDQSLCPTPISCPDKYPVLCSDGDCVASLALCRDSIQCPAYKPIRCGTGECKKSLSECPTQIVCPAGYQIRCQDGSCVKDKATCESIVNKTQCPDGQMKCGDGSCSVSYSLCPTAVSCAPLQIRCWNMACADDVSSCDPLSSGQTVCDVDKIQCPDGSCANNITDCPTRLICPFDRPIKCDDGNCRESVDNCLRYSDCLETYKRCPDGTCQIGRCSSVSVTCSTGAPYKCYDNTCKKNPFDCPSIPECSIELPILCTEGNCVASRMDCSTADFCPLAQPVRCPDGLCYSSSDKCQAIEDCPATKQLCDNGACVGSNELCASLGCPKNVPFLCPNGICIRNLTHCDDINSGCPFDKPVRCSNGQCRDALIYCPKKESCSNNLTLCPDGTCRASNSSCPLANGCPKLQPMRCFSGFCVDPTIQSCPIAKCPKKLPFKCPNGLCMPKLNACPSIYVPTEQNPCSGNLFNRNILCADGSCAETLNECKPTFKCPFHSVKCNDGSCAFKRSLCPLAPNSCPVGLRYRCENRACVNNSQDCLNEQGCPSSKPLKCGHHGICAISHEECESLADFIILPNNCTLKNPIKCHNNTCVRSLKDCRKVSKCTGSYECMDGTCQNNISLCPSSCPSNQVLCPLNKKCANSTQDCLLSNGCPANLPKKCSNGSCISTFDRCPVHITCPLFKPYLCADLECVGEPSQCSVIPQCPNNQPVRCSDLSCTRNANQCQNTTVCPPTNIIKCSTGECVDSVDECKNSLTLVQCSNEKPYLCSNQECVVRPSDCVSSAVKSGTHARILQGASNLIIDQGCDANNPKLCSDGSCKGSYSDCDLINGCFEVLYPYRCQSGECTANIEDCTQDKSLASCSNNTSRCVDGICRVQCPDYDGCSLVSPLQCPNGFCVNEGSQCEQQNNKMVCVDNTVGDCDRPIRSYQSEKLTLTISRYLSSSVSFISNNEINSKYATLDIPAGAFVNSTVDYPYDILTINPVAWSSIKNTTNSFINEKIMNYLFNGATKLTIEQFIRSTVFSLSVLNSTQGMLYSQPLNLMISIDQIQRLSTNSYCLGYLTTTGQWTCEDSSNSTDALNSKNQLSFNIRRDGTYAVILALKTTSYLQGGIQENSNCDWWCENGGAVIGAIVGVLIGGLVFGVFFFVFTKYGAKRPGNAGVNEQLIGKNEDANEGKRKMEEMAQNLHQKDKIISETINENEMINEQNEKLMKELQNLKKELGKA